jgi:hypothetical protein
MIAGPVQSREIDSEVRPPLERDFHRWIFRGSNGVWAGELAASALRSRRSRTKSMQFAHNSASSFVSKPILSTAENGLGEKERETAVVFANHAIVYALSDLAPKMISPPSNNGERFGLIVNIILGLLKERRDFVGNE